MRVEDGCGRVRKMRPGDTRPEKEPQPMSSYEERTSGANLPLPGITGEGNGKEESDASRFVIDNDRHTMRSAMDMLVQKQGLDICTAFLDAYGIAAIGQVAEHGTLRFLVGYELSDQPTDKDIVTFEMAHEWQRTHQDPVVRVWDDSEIQEATRLLALDTFEAERSALRMHSKAYIAPDVAIVGSSNTTRAGLDGQRELNIAHYDSEAVRDLRDWFERTWKDAKDAAQTDFKQELASWLTNARLEQYAPFHVYAKAIYERYRHRFVSFARTAGEVELAIFQEEGRDAALNILAEHHCCIVADAVGLGKTYIALGAMQRRAQARPRADRTILIICPAQLEPVWQDAARSQALGLMTESMETLGSTTGAAADSRLQDLASYGLVIVDEAHNFRNPNTNRFMALMEMLQKGPRDKDVLLLTATPINNSVMDLYSLLRIMTRDNDAYFLRTSLGIPSLREHFKSAEKGAVSLTDLLLEIMVCRSRQDIRQRQSAGEVITIQGKEVRFPERRLETLDYKLAATGAALSYDALAVTVENLILPAYNVEDYARNPDHQRRERFASLQTLFKILMLKRLESSVVSFVSTANSLLEFSRTVVSALKQGKALSNEEYRSLQLGMLQGLTDDDEGAPRQSPYLEGLLERNPDDYDLQKMERDVQKDSKAILPIITQAQALIGANDGKLARLKTQLKQLLPMRKVLVFTFYRDTAEYLYEQITGDPDFMNSIDNCRVEYLAGGVAPATKNLLVREFAPNANGREDQPPEKPIQLLIATDVLSEGQNLQDCGYLINYDLHFNPVRMIQRNGRIDRLFSEHSEVTIANFFPEGDLEAHLGIVRRLQSKLEEIQNTLPADSSVLGERVRIFSLEELQQTRKGNAKIIETIDEGNPINRFHDTLEKVIKLLIDFGIDQIRQIPFGCQSNKRSTTPGVFLCIAEAKRDNPGRQCWWLYYDGTKIANGHPEAPKTDVAAIFNIVESQRPPDESHYHPEVQPREIRWDIVLAAKEYCREMMVKVDREEQQGQVWPQRHINLKLQQFFAARPGLLEEEYLRALGTTSLERQKAELQGLLKEATDGNTQGLLDAVHAALQPAEASGENPETAPLEVVAYMELVPETEAGL